MDYGLCEEAEIEVMRLSENIQYDALYHVAIQYIKANDFSDAIKLLTYLVDKKEDKKYYYESLNLIIVLEFLDGNYSNAVKYIVLAQKSYPDKNSEDLYEKILLAEEGNWSFEGMNGPRFRSPQLARIMSFILPGSGQVYTKKYSEALRTMVINGVFGYIVTDAFSRGLYPRALTTFYFFGARYWIGNSENAANDARQFNHKERKLAAHRAIGELECCEE
ncbi:hypothetical protein KAH81_03330 [bacterium]|nr:hypothetical protein [bacterium]